MDNKLDKYFRDRLNDREFNLSDSYWEDAEKLLDAQGRRRRRGLIFWWFGGLASVGLIVAAIWLTSQKNSPVENTPTMLRQAEHAGQPIENDAVVGNLGAGAELPTTKDPGIEETAMPSGHGNRPSRPGIQNSSAPAVAPAEPKLPVFANKGNLEKQGSHSTASPVQQLEAPGEVVMQEDLKESASADSAVVEAEPMAWQHSDLLPIDVRLVFVEGEFQRNIFLKTTQESAQPATPWSFGLLLSQLYQTGVKSGEKTVIGYQGGVVVQYRLNQQWHLGSGLSYKYRTGTFEASKAYEAVKYSFGKTINTIALRTSSVHYLSVPVQLGWQHSRHVLEGGMAFDLLLGLRGATGAYEVIEGPSYQRVFRPEQKGWLVEDGYKKLNTAATLGYRYRLNRQLSVGIQGGYTFGSILKKDYETSIGSQLLKEDDKFYLDLRAIYLIK